MASISSENTKGSTKKMKVHFDLPKDEDHNKKHSSSSISSQSSLGSDNNIETFEESNTISSGSPVWSIQSGTVTQSPPPQFMSSNPNSAFDPNRIPSSVFTPKSTSNMEWSVQSNESLFSLHLGNYSFSRDQFYAFNGKSGEMPKTNDLTGVSAPLPCVVQEVKHSNDDNIVEGERHSLSSDSSHDSTNKSDKTTKNLTLENDYTSKTSNEKVNIVLKDEDHDKIKTSIIVEKTTLNKTQDGKIETSTNVEKTTLNKTQDDPSKATAIVPSEEPKNYETIISYRSIESNTSNYSFQFPIFTADGVRTSTSESVVLGKPGKNEKQQQHQQQPPPSPPQQQPPPSAPPQQQQQELHQQEQPVKPSSPKSETTPKHSSRSWCCFSWFSCSPCF